MKARETGRRKRKNKDRLGNRLAVIGISVVVLSLAVVVNVKNTSMEKNVMEYQAREEALTRQVENEKKRAADIEEVAKQKLGLVKPDEILLKPAPKNN